jgi:hypothetical protein
MIIFGKFWKILSFIQFGQIESFFSLVFQFCAKFIFRSKYSFNVPDCLKFVVQHLLDPLMCHIQVQFPNCILQLMV